MKYNVLKRGDSVSDSLSLELHVYFHTLKTTLASTTKPVLQELKMWDLDASPLTTLQLATAREESGYKHHKVKKIAKRVLKTKMWRRLNNSSSLATKDKIA